MATSRRSPDPLRIASAQILGTVERCVVANRLTEDQALVEIGAALGPVPEPSWHVVLADAAAGHVDTDEPWRRAALHLLVRAGADIDQARRRHDARPTGYSGRFTQ
jgi:hypothetical protein